MEKKITFAPPNNNSTLTMKFPVLSVVAMAAVLLVACGPSEAEIAAAKEKAAADSIAALDAMEHVYLVDPAASKLTWKGTMLGVKSHHGTVSMSEGKFITKGGMLVGGSFAIDMKSIAPLDSAYAPDGSKEGTKSMLIGHLSSPDFFAVEEFPTAMFEFTNVEGSTGKGTLTVRGKSNDEQVTDIVVTEENGIAKASGKLSFNRQKYDVAWKAPMKDVVLNDAIELTVELTGKAQ